MSQVTDVSDGKKGKAYCQSQYVNNRQSKTGVYDNIHGLFTNYFTNIITY
jgi:hypothetical protein